MALPLGDPKAVINVSQPLPYKMSFYTEPKGETEPVAQAAEKE